MLWWRRSGFEEGSFSAPDVRLVEYGVDYSYGYLTASSPKKVADAPRISTFCEPIWRRQQTVRVRSSASCIPAERTEDRRGYFFNGLCVIACIEPSRLLCLHDSQLERRVLRWSNFLSATRCNSCRIEKALWWTPIRAPTIRGSINRGSSMRSSLVFWSDLRDTRIACAIAPTLQKGTTSTASTNLRQVMDWTS